MQCADRVAIERVYYAHRLGNKPPFEQLLPPALVEKRITKDLRKEAVLKKVYGIEITAAMVEAEFTRIDATTRAPDVLAELKAALGNDQTRFARAVVKPMVVERTLRDRIANDDKPHAAQRRQADQVRNDLLASKKSSGGFDKFLASLKLLSHRAERNDVAARSAPGGKRQAKLRPRRDPKTLRPERADFFLAAV